MRLNHANSGESIGTMPRTKTGASTAPTAGEPGGIKIAMLPLTTLPSRAFMVGKAPLLGFPITATQQQMCLSCDCFVLRRRKTTTLRLTARLELQRTRVVRSTKLPSIVTTNSKEVTQVRQWRTWTTGKVSLLGTLIKVAGMLRSKSWILTRRLRDGRQRSVYPPPKYKYFIIQPFGYLLGVLLLIFSRTVHAEPAWVLYCCNKERVSVARLSLHWNFFERERDHSTTSR